MEKHFRFWNTRIKMFSNWDTYQNAIYQIFFSSILGNYIPFYNKFIFFMNLFLTNTIILFSISMMSYRLRAKRNSINQSGKKRLKKKSKGWASNIGIILFFICNQNNYEMTFFCNKQGIHACTLFIKYHFYFYNIYIYIYIYWKHNSLLNWYILCSQVSTFNKHEEKMLVF